MTQQQGRVPSPEDVASLSEKLLQYRQTLPEAEQQALDSIVAAALRSTQADEESDTQGFSWGNYGFSAQYWQNFGNSMNQGFKGTGQAWSNAFSGWKLW
jgi:hypothetical protein